MLTWGNREESTSAMLLRRVGLLREHRYSVARHVVSLVPLTLLIWIQRYLAGLAVSEFGPDLSPADIKNAVGMMLTAGIILYLVLLPLSWVLADGIAALIGWTCDFSERALREEATQYGNS